MRIGTFCYATSRGLGHLAKAFRDHGVITDTLVIRHSRVPTNEDWYPDAINIDHRHLNEHVNQEKLREFVKGMDAMLFFETPFDWSIFGYCAERKIRTYLVTMYECTPIRHAPPYRYICPSDLDLQYFPPERSVRLNLPVEVPWKLRTKAEVFVHNGGYLGLRGREGTCELIAAMEYVKSPLKLIIRVQENVKALYLDRIAKEPRIDYRPATVPYEELFATGDVYIAPQKFNGCSLPLQEAYASGMAVMTTDRFPMNSWLPKKLLIPTELYNEDVSIGGPYMRFKEAVVSPRDIAAKMDSVYGTYIGNYSLDGKGWAAMNSWEALKPLWMEALSK